MESRVVDGVLDRDFVRVFKNKVREKPSFTDQRLRSLPIPERAFRFYRSEPTAETLIDPRNIIGATHPNYINLTWHELLVGKPEWGMPGLQRHHDLWQKFEARPDYYLNHQELKKGILYIEINGKLYVDAGIHRSTLARYLAHYVPGFAERGFGPVPVMRVVIDKELEGGCGAVARALKEFRIDHLSLSVEVGNGYPTSGEYKIWLKHKRKHGKASWLLDRSDLHQLPNAFRQRRWWHTLSKGERSLEYFILP